MSRSSKFQRSNSVSSEIRNARIIAGTHSILESLRVWPKGAKELWLKKGYESHGDLVEIESLAKKLKVIVHIKSEGQIENLTLAHQGALLFQTHSPAWPTPDQLKADTTSQVLMLLDGLEDPHNLGAIMRTSWLMGAKGLIIPQHRAVGLTPAVHKVASGGAEHMPILEVNQFAPTLEELKSYGFWVFGLSHKAKSGIFSLKLPSKVVWCVGAEDKGLRSTTEKLCDELVSLPQLSPEASYNASVAAGMVLFENFRQHSLNS